MISKKIKIQSKIGIHLRPAGVLCEAAANFKCKVSIQREDKTVNAKSLLNVLSACIKYGDEIELICDGEDEVSAMEKMTDVLETKINVM